MSIQYTAVSQYVVTVVCARCFEDGPTGEPWGSEAGAQTSACDRAKAEGWAVNNLRAYCPDCARAIENTESNQEDPACDEPASADLTRDSQAADLRLKR